jgi:hypothetical protein
MPDSALPHQPQSAGLGAGPIAGAVIGAVAALAVVVIGWMAIKRRRQQKPMLAFEPAVLGLHLNPAHVSAAELATKSASAHYLYAALDLPSPEYVSAHRYELFVDTSGTAPTAGNLLYNLEICDGPSYHIPLEHEPAAPAALDLPSPNSAHHYEPFIDTSGTAPTAGNLLYNLDICDGPSYHIPLERQPAAPAYMVPFDSPVCAAEAAGGHACGDTYAVPF